MEETDLRRRLKRRQFLIEEITTAIAEDKSMREGDRAIAKDLVVGAFEEFFNLSDSLESIAASLRGIEMNTRPQTP